MTRATREAALFLLASRWLGQNTDRLARVTGSSSPQASRYARRLYDNGIWHSGNLVRAWDDEISDPSSFWADAHVAEGIAHRRTTVDGLLEWAPVGSWWKGFELGAGREAAPAANAYQARIEPESAPLWERGVDSEDPDEAPGAEGSVVELPLAAESPFLGGQPGTDFLGMLPGAVEVDFAGTAAESLGRELFPKAPWLR